MTKAKYAQIAKAEKALQKDMLIKAMQCRKYLYTHGFLTSWENDSVHDRLDTFQKEKGIKISMAEFDKI